MGLTLGTIIFVFREMIAEFYTNIEEVKEETIMLFAFLAVFHQADSIQGVAGGVLRGLGKTVHASVITGISYWVISLPMEYLFAFHFGYGVIGLWIGQMCGSIFHAVVYVYLVNFHFGDWVSVAN